MNYTERSPGGFSNRSLRQMLYTYHGKSAHAQRPWKGLSALDAVLLLFHGMEMLREHSEPQFRFHGVITNGGVAPNIVPPSAQHQMTATEDGPLEYLYIKDKTWTTVGLSVEEAVPDKATTLEEAHQEFKQSGWAPGKGEIRKDKKKSSAVVEGLENCYYSIIETFDMPPASANRRYLFDGVRMRFEFNEAVQGFEQTQRQSPHELFWYLLCGELEARVGDENEQVGSGGVIHIPKGESYHILSEKNKCVRYLNVCSTPVLESVLEE